MNKPTKDLHPFCNVCGWRKGGVDSWDGIRCKCGHSAPPLAGIGFGELLNGAEKTAAQDLHAEYGRLVQANATLANGLRQAINIIDDCAAMPVDVSWLKAMLPSTTAPDRAGATHE